MQGDNLTGITPQAPTLLRKHPCWVLPTSLLSQPDTLLSNPGLTAALKLARFAAGV